MKPKGWLSDEDDRLTPEREMWQNPDEPISHYYRWIWEYLAYLTLICDLKRESRVLELGCHHGRTSRGLLQYIRSPGSYIGFDISKRHIEEATRRITSLAGNFEYVHADVYNREYNPEGSISASEFHFPIQDESIDCAYAASVFTHLLPEETANYFAQTARVLKLGGKALYSFFVLDVYRGAGTTISQQYEFETLYQGDTNIGVKHADYPDACIAYRERWIRHAAEESGLTLTRIVPGLWSNAPGIAVNEQDLILLSK